MGNIIRIKTLIMINVMRIKTLIMRNVIRIKTLKMRNVIRIKSYQEKNFLIIRTQSTPWASGAPLMLAAITFTGGLSMALEHLALKVFRQFPKKITFVL